MSSADSGAPRRRSPIQTERQRPRSPTLPETAFVEGADGGAVGANYPLSPTLPQSYASRAPLTVLDAVKAGNFEALKALLEEGQPAHSVDDCGDTPLMHAARKGRPDLASALIDKGALVNAEDLYGATALMHCFPDGIQGVIQVLSDRDSGRPSCLAARGCDDDCSKIVRMLLAGRANANHQDNSGVNALMLAAATGRRKSVKMLLIQGSARINDKDLGGWSPLAWAANEGWYDVVKLLSRNGAEISAADRETWDAIIWSSFFDQERRKAVTAALKAAGWCWWMSGVAAARGTAAANGWTLL